MTPKEKIIKAKKLLWEATEEIRIGNKKKREKEEMDRLCVCGHKRSQHSESYSINFTGGVCKKCNCLNYMQKPNKEELKKIEEARI